MERNKFLLILIPGLLAAGGVTAAYLQDGPRADAVRQATVTTSVAVLSARSPATGTSAAPHSTAAGDSFSLVDGRVDAHLRNARLPATVARIAAAAGVELVGGQILADAPVQVDLDGVPAAEALLRLTAGYDTSFEYRHSRLTRMTIGLALQADSEDPSSGAGDWAANFYKMDPEQRGDAIEAMTARGDDQAREALAHALTDTDEEVRFRALEQAQVVKGLALPVDMLQKVLQQDASETVRLKALDVLATDPAVDADTLTTIAGSVASDPSEQLRNQALQLRQRLDQGKSATSQ